ncbi:MAG TPA: aldo/keto reductase [Roseiflexaceae bacterium]|nr:aldo/keto reductase [Roseiflexaceae bacterium]
MTSTSVMPTFTFQDGPTIKRLGFGAMRLTGEGIWGEPKNPDEAKAVLRRVLELGINFIDTADSYGPDVSERLIGETLAPYPAGVVIATKGGMVRPGPNKWETNGRPEHLREALEGSLKRLKVETIDLYQFHRPDPNVPFEDSVGTIARMREEGKIRMVGLSNVSVEQLEKAQQIVPIVSVQNRFNLTDRSSDDVLEACEQKKIGFIPWAPIAANNLQQGVLNEIARRLNATPNQVALAWLLRRSPVMLPIPGTSSVQHLEENIQAADLQLSDDDVERLNSAQG